MNGDWMSYLWDIQTSTNQKMQTRNSKRRKPSEEEDYVDGVAGCAHNGVVGCAHDGAEDCAHDGVTTDYLLEELIGESESEVIISDNARVAELDDYSFLHQIPGEGKDLDKEQRAEIFRKIISTSHGVWFFRRYIYIPGMNRDGCRDSLPKIFKKHVKTYDFKDEFLTDAETKLLKKTNKYLLKDGSTCWEIMREFLSAKDRHIRDNLRKLIKNLKIDVVACKGSNQKFWEFENQQPHTPISSIVGELNEENHTSLFFIISLATALMCSEPTAIIDRRKIELALEKLCTGKALKTHIVFGLLGTHFLSVISSILDADSNLRPLSKGSQIASSEKNSSLGYALRLASKWKQQPHAIDIQGLHLIWLQSFMKKCLKKKSNDHRQANIEEKYDAEIDSFTNPTIKDFE